MVKNGDDMLSRFHLIPERYGQTDRQTDRQTDGRTDGQNCYISMLTRDKKSRCTDKVTICRYGKFA